MNSHLIGQEDGVRLAVYHLGRKACSNRPSHLEPLFGQWRRQQLPQRFVEKLKPADKIFRVHTQGTMDTHHVDLRRDGQPAAHGQPPEIDDALPMNLHIGDRGKITSQPGVKLQTRVESGYYRLDTIATDTVAQRNKTTG